MRTQGYELAGQRFNRLLVIERHQLDRKSIDGWYWLCKCDCGNEKIIRASSLVQKLVQSCGCLQRESRSLRRGPKHPMYGRTKEQNPNWKGGKYKDQDGYIYVRCTDHPHASNRGYVFEHRLVMEKHLGRYLEPEEVVHHIDGNKENNKIENLSLFANNGNHIGYHDKQRKAFNFQGCVVKEG
jgi:hypothetical protein